MVFIPYMKDGMCIWDNMDFIQALLLELYIVDYLP